MSQGSNCILKMEMAILYACSGFHYSDDGSYYSVQLDQRINYILKVDKINPFEEPRWLNYVLDGDGYSLLRY